MYRMYYSFELLKSSEMYIKVSTVHIIYNFLCLIFGLKYCINEYISKSFVRHNRKVSMEIINLLILIMIKESISWGRV